MCSNRAVVEISSDEDQPTKKKRPFSKEEVICLDDSEPSTSNKIEITIEQPRRRVSLHPAPTPTKITIRFEEDLPQSPALTLTDQHPALLTPSKTQPIRRTSKDETVESFSDFVQLCLLLDRTADMEKVVEKKVKHYYERAEEEYKCSDRFKKLLADKKELMRKDAANLWVHVKDVVDALRAHKKEELCVSESGGAEEASKDPKVEERVKELEQKLGVLKDLVQRLEEQEVDWDEDDNSAYIRADKYKARMVRVYSELCRLRGARACSYGRVRMGREGRAARRLEEWVNRPVARGLPPRFPDFHVVLSCVREACRHEQAEWSDQRMRHEARELFVSCGRALQRRRRYRDRQLAAELLTHTLTDPADTDTQLHAHLQSNAVVAKRKEQQVFDEFETKEILLKSKKEIDKKSQSDVETAETKDPPSPAVEVTDLRKKETQAVSPKGIEDRSVRETGDVSAREIDDVIVIETEHVSQKRTADNSKKGKRKTSIKEVADVTVKEMENISGTGIENVSPKETEDVIVIETEDANDIDKNVNAKTTDVNTKGKRKASMKGTKDESARETRDGGRVRGDLITSCLESSEDECVYLGSDQSEASSTTHEYLSSDEDGVAICSLPPSPAVTLASDSSDSECVVIADS